MKRLLAVLALVAALPPRRALAFELPPQLSGIGLLDALFIAVAAYFAVRLIGNLMSKKEDQQGPPTYDVTPEEQDPKKADPSGQDSRRAQAQAAWDYLSGGKNDKTDAASTESGQPFSQNSSRSLPQNAGRSGEESQTFTEGRVAEGFDEAEFLRGAKLMYVRVRKAWAQRDLDDLALFTTPEMQARFTAWANGSADPEPLDVLLVNARLAEVRQEEERTVVQVSYEATLTDNPKAPDTKKVQEAWSFIKNNADPKATWKLDDLQNVH